MASENVKLGDLPMKRVEKIIDDTADRFGKLCAECFRKAAREIARPDMEVKTLVTRAVARAIYNKENTGMIREPLSVVMEEQGESELVPDEPVPDEPEPSFAVHLKNEGDMDDTA